MYQELVFVCSIDSFLVWRYLCRESYIIQQSRLYGADESTSRTLPYVYVFQWLTHRRRVLVGHFLTGALFKPRFYREGDMEAHTTQILVEQTPCNCVSLIN